MFDFSKNKINAVENASIIRRVSSEMKKLGVFVGISTFSDFTLPAFTDDLIPELENIYKNNTFELYKSISTVLKVKNFYDVNISDVIDNYDSVIVGSDYIVYNNVLYSQNPINKRSKSIINRSKMFRPSDISFNDFGIISKKQMVEVKEILLSTRGVSENTPVNILELKFQEIIKKSILNEVEEIKLTILESGRVVVEFKKNVGYFNAIKEYVDSRNFLDFIINRVSNIKKSTDSLNIKLKKENDKSYKIFLYHNNDKSFGDLISEIEGQSRVDMINSIKNLKSGLVVISSNDISSEKISYQIVDEIRGKRSIDITQVDDYIKYKIKDSLFTNDYKLASETSSDIIIIKCSNDSDFKTSLNLSQKGRLVICYMNSSSVENTLQTIKDSYSSCSESALIQLKSIIHISQIDRACNNCKTTEMFYENSQHHLISKASEDFNFSVSKECKSGCSLCVNGYIDKINIFEMIYKCDPLDRYIKGLINVNDLIIEMKGDDWPDILTMSMQHLSDGNTTISSIVNSTGY